MLQSCTPLLSRGQPVAAVLHVTLQGNDGRESIIEELIREQGLKRVEEGTSTEETLSTLTGRLACMWTGGQNHG
mgnify:CR=1 FL=1